MILGASLEDLIHIEYRNYLLTLLNNSKKLPEHLSNNYPLVAKRMTVTLKELIL